MGNTQQTPGDRIPFFTAKRLITRTFVNSGLITATVVYSTKIMHMYSEWGQDSILGFL